MLERFSSSGLASARADELQERGIEAAVRFDPREPGDPQPFVVEYARLPDDMHPPASFGAKGR